MVDFTYYPPRAKDFPELNYVDEKENIVAKRVVIEEDPRQYFEPVTFDDKKNCKNIQETPDYIFSGHHQLLDRITSTPNFPNLIFIASKRYVHIYNQQSRELKEFYKYENVSDYSNITAMKAYKNSLFIGSSYGDVVKVTIHSETSHEEVIRNTTGMKNGFCFYEYKGKDYVMVASNSTPRGLETYEIGSMTLVNSLPIPLPEYCTCLGGVAISNSKRFFAAIGDKSQSYVYEIIPNGEHCTYKIRQTIGVTGNCHTADWAPDDSCFAVTCEAGECYLFSFKETNKGPAIKLKATYQNISPKQEDPFNYNGAVNAIEVIKFHPKPSVPIMVFTAAHQMKIYVVNYRTFNIVQTLTFQEGSGLINNGIEFSVDGRYLFTQYVAGNWMGKGGKLITLKLKEVGTLADICLEYLRKNKASLDAGKLQQILPDTLFEKLSLHN